MRIEFQFSTQKKKFYSNFNSHFKDSKLVKTIKMDVKSVITIKKIFLKACNQLQLDPNIHQITNTSGDSLEMDKCVGDFNLKNGDTIHLNQKKEEDDSSTIMVKLAFYGGSFPCFSFSSKVTII